jgi:hypothetical protein
MASWNRVSIWFKTRSSQPRVNPRNRYAHPLVPRQWHALGRGESLATAPPHLKASLVKRHRVHAVVVGDQSSRAISGKYSRGYWDQREPPRAAERSSHWRGGLAL